MRLASYGMMLVAAGAVTAMHGEMRFVGTGPARAASSPVFGPRLDPPLAAERPVTPWHLAFGKASAIRSVAGGVDATPFVTALPGEMWHGRRRSFGSAGGAGFSGDAVRARSVGIGEWRSGKPASGFLAGALRYGVPVGEDALLTVNLSAATQRMPPMETIGLGKAVHIGSLYLGGGMVRDRLSLTAGWYRVSIGTLSPFDYAIERTAGMPAAGQGVRLGMAWRLGATGTQAPARLSLEMRDGDADRDRRVGLGSGTGRERRVLLRFTEAF